MALAMAMASSAGRLLILVGLQAVDSRDLATKEIRRAL